MSQELVRLLREQNGEKSSAMLRMLLHGTLWLSHNRFAWQAARLRGLALDMGEGFNTSFEQTERWVVKRGDAVSVSFGTEVSTHALIGHMERRLTVFQ